LVLYRTSLLIAYDTFKRLADYVELEDVNEAARLLRDAIKQYAWDPETGKIDMDLINTGQGSHERRVLEDIRNALQELLKRKEGTRVPWRSLLQELNEQSDVVCCFLFYFRKFSQASSPL
jgi:DNA replication licensing factor MCM4